jgi:hypothetical protein
MKLIMPSEIELRGFPRQEVHFAGWFHYERPWRPTDEVLLSHILGCGCRLILVTGEEHETIHESLDWIVPEVTKDVVLTLSDNSINEDSAFDFVSTNCASGPPSFGMLHVFSGDVATEMRLLVNMKRLIDIQALR